MSDLQTEIFTKVLPKMQSLTNLTFDDGPDATVEVVSEAFTTNITAMVWEFISKHPKCSVKDISAHIGDDKGVSTRVNQLRSRGYIETDYSEFPHRHSVTSKPYATTTREEKTARLMAARAIWAKNVGMRKQEKAKAKAKPKKEVAAPKPEARPTRVVDLNNLSIVEARKLYDELKQIFGG
jgi:hypothetical protein